MPTLGQILTDDLTSKLNDSNLLNDALEFTSDALIESIKDLSEQGFSADGSPWESLGDSHAQRKGGDYTADLRFKFYSTDGAMDNIYASIQGDNSFEFEFGNSEMDAYMRAHQYGLSTGRLGRSKMPVRKWAPEDDDMESAIQQQTLQEIENFITEYLNQPSTVSGSQIISL
jgi:phage gpG-like protein